MTTGKTIALTIWTFVGKVMSLLFNMLSSLVITFLPSSKHLLISWLQSPSAVIFSSVAQLCPTLCNPMDCSTWMFPCPSPTPGVYSNSHPLSRWCHRTIHPLSFPSPPAFNLSQHQGLLKQVSSLHQVAKILEFQLQHQSFQWTPRSDFFRMDQLDLLAIQGTLKSLLQYHSSKASVLQCSAFFMVQFSHPYITTGKHSFD